MPPKTYSNFKTPHQYELKLLAKKLETSRPMATAGLKAAPETPACEVSASEWVLHRLFATGLRAWCIPTVRFHLLAGY